MIWFCPCLRGIFVLRMTNISEITIDYKKKIDIDLVQRVERSLIYLVQLIQKAYGEELKATHGSAGGIGGIVSNVIHRPGFVEGQIGFTKAADYMKFLEWGVKPAAGAEWPAMSKMPPVRSIYQWMSLARSKPSQAAIDQAKANEKRLHSKRKHPQFEKHKNAPWYSTDPQMIAAFWLAQTIKAKGRPALRMMDKVLRANIAQVTKYIQGEA